MGHGSDRSCSFPNVTSQLVRLPGGAWAEQCSAAPDVCRASVRAVGLLSLRHQPDSFYHYCHFIAAGRDATAL